jgi:hypothetical protein
MTKELRHLLNRYGRRAVEAKLAELIANPTERYMALWPEDNRNGRT